MLDKNRFNTLQVDGEVWDVDAQCRLANDQRKVTVYQLPIFGSEYDYLYQKFIADSSVVVEGKLI